MSDLDDKTVARFWAKVNKADSCWLWTAYTHRKGYGVFRHMGRSVFAYRFAYESFVGQVPTGLELDHLCRNRACVNPAHLEPVTHAENVRRGRSGEVNGARQRSKTHCPSGHEFTEANTLVSHQGYRACKACKYPIAAARRERVAARRRTESSRRNAASGSTPPP